MEYECSYDELPAEIWELIVNNLGDDHPAEFESLSLVNKRFLSLTNRLRRRLAVVNQTYFIHGTIRPLLYRFPNLKTLDLSDLLYGYRDMAIREIARSSMALNLESLDISSHDVLPKDRLEELGSSNSCKIKVLKCANVTRLSDTDLIDIANYFSDLEELDISYPQHKSTIDPFRAYTIAELMITDYGVKRLALVLKNLVKIDLSMNILLTDNCLKYLSSNCLLLQEVKFLNCAMITMKGLRFVLQNCPDIRTISMSLITSIHGNPLFMNNATSCRHLSSLYFKDSDISDEFLRSIVEARIPLKRLCLPGCDRYTISGITSLLSAYQSLTYLNLSRNNYLSDETVIASSQYLHDLVKIKLNFCRKLTGKALFALINNCSFLEQIKMEHTDLGKEEVAVVMDVVKRKNFSIKTLKLAGNSHLTDECLLKITSVCPNLKFLDVSSSGIAGSIGEILSGCPEIRHLNIQDCVGVMNIGLKMEPLKLQTLCMARSGVNDEGLVMIAARCNDLMKIDLEGCRHVTTNAVKYLLKNCEKLRELNLMGCPNLDVFIVEWMVTTRPSLRKLIPPSFAVTNQSQRIEYLREHGCYVCDH